jgi:hypothetical protein
MRKRLSETSETVYDVKQNGVKSSSLTFIFKMWEYSAKERSFSNECKRARKNITVEVL